MVSQSTATGTESQEGLEITDLEIVDSAGQEMKIAIEGDQISVRSVVWNNADVGLILAYVVQVKDSSNKVVFLSFAVKEIGSGKSLAIETPIAAALTGSGNHSVQAFAWQNIESPPMFSFSSVWLRVVSDRIPAIGCSGSASCISGMVTRVIDGDTIVVNDFTVRFTLIDTPEREQAGFQEASSFTSSICRPGTRVLLDEDDGQTSGSYGRMVAKVYCVGGMANEELLRSRNAVILTEYCERSEFAREQWAVAYGCWT